MEEDAQRCPIRLVVTVKVVRQEVVKLVTGLNVCAAVHHRAARQFLIKVGVISSVKLVHDHLPDGVRPRWAVLSVSVTLMRHSEVQRVRPKGRVGEGCGNGRVVEEGLLLHHEELVVSSYSKVRGSDADDGVVGDVGESLDDESDAGHLLCPGFSARLAPVLFIRVVADK